MHLYAFAKALLWPIYHCLFRFRVEGRENVPLTGGMIICANHFRAHDPIVLGLETPRRIAFMAKQELFSLPVIGFLISWGLGAFPVKRGQPDRSALKRSLALLESGGCFGIFPEGTRNRTGRLKKAEPGTAYLALKSGAPVIPVAISGTYRPFRSLVVRFGEPVNLERFRTEKLTGETLENAGEAIMAAIGTLLGPPAPTGSREEEV